MAKLLLQSGSPFLPHPGPLAEFDTRRLFWQAALKLHHARLHGHALGYCWVNHLQYHSEHFSGLATDPEDGSRYLPGMIPVSWDVALFLSDTIRTLRSSLDYLVSKMARSAGLSDHNTVFPFAKERKDVESSFQAPRDAVHQKRGRRAGAFFELSQQYPGLKEIVLDSIQPYSSDDGKESRGDCLWRLIKTDNIDKHRLVMPTAPVTSHFLPIYVTNGIRLTGTGSIIGDAIRFPPGAELENDVRATVEVIFAEPSPFASREVFGTLAGVFSRIQEVIAVFEEAFGTPHI